MKNINIIEAIAVCLFSVFLFSCAIAQETGLKPRTAAYVSQQVKADEQINSSSLSVNPAQASSFNIVSYISFSKVVSSIIVFVVVVSLLIVLVAFILYNTYSIRP